jgi:hypothetical protein
VESGSFTDMGHSLIMYVIQVLAIPSFIFSCFSLNSFNNKNTIRSIKVENHFYKV